MYIVTFLWTITRCDTFFTLLSHTLAYTSYSSQLLLSIQSHCPHPWSVGPPRNSLAQFIFNSCQTSSVCIYHPFFLIISDNSIHLPSVSPILPIISFSIPPRYTTTITSIELSSYHFHFSFLFHSPLDVGLMFGPS